MTGRVAALSRVLTAIALLLLFATPALLPATAAGEPGSTSFLKLTIDRVTPDIVTTTSGSVVTVAGTVRNIGDRPVRDVVVRLEHAPAVDGSAGLRTNLSGNLDQYTAVAPFVTLSAELQPGQEVPYNLAYHVRCAQ